jgi:hypothetical protein
VHGTLRIEVTPLKPKREDPGSPERLLARIADLEQRVMLLEAKVRALSADSRRERTAASDGTRAKSAKPRVRCPGCLLELPPGRKGESCVWCGFYFDVVKMKAVP